MHRERLSEAAIVIYSDHKSRPLVSDTGGKLLLLLVRQRESVNSPKTHLDIEWERNLCVCVCLLSTITILFLRYGPFYSFCPGPTLCLARAPNQFFYFYFSFYLYTCVRDGQESQESPLSTCWYIPTIFYIEADRGHPIALLISMASGSYFDMNLAIHIQPRIQ